MTLRTVPLSRRFVVSAGAGRRARRVRTLAGTSDWRRNSLDALGAAVVFVAGTRTLRASPGWRWPELDLDTIQHEVRATLPGLRVDAAVMPRQPDRARLSLLCRMPGRSGDVDVVVKLANVADGLGNEALALSLLSDRPLPGIATPAVLATGFLDTDITYLATDALGLGRQRPALDEPLRSFERDLAERLAALPRPAGTPDDAVPVHGDLAPWNLRRTGRGLALFDWEEARWGAAGSDVEYYRRSCAELRSARFRSRFTARPR
jgi:Ser/Thr protein kinase RdoA (MazF antagonist)